jgi:hypothetical protein
VLGRAVARSTDHGCMAGAPRKSYLSSGAAENDRAWNTPSGGGSIQPIARSRAIRDTFFDALRRAPKTRWLGRFGRTGRIGAETASSIQPSAGRRSEVCVSGCKTAPKRSLLGGSLLA